jgi:8-oxo-dGTP pyrophosphatase MutT (NUDIX family)
MNDKDPPIRPAATTVCVRNGQNGLEVLLVRRSRKLVFYGSAWAFPGGRVDPEDAPPDADLYQEPAARAAAVREAREETSVVLAPEALVPLSHWTTPPGRPRRFRTWFFLVRPEIDLVVVDAQEIDQHRWIAPKDALTAQARTEISLPPPTFVTLRWLEGFEDAEGALETARAQELELFVPRIVAHEDHFVSLYQGDAGYGGRDLNAPGARHRLWLRPGGWHYERD